MSFWVLFCHFVSKLDNIARLIATNMTTSLWGMNFTLLWTRTKQARNPLSGGSNSTMKLSSATYKLLPIFSTILFAATSRWRYFYNPSVCCVAYTSNVIYVLYSRYLGGLVNLKRKMVILPASSFDRKAVWSEIVWALSGRLVWVPVLWKVKLVVLLVCQGKSKCV